MKATKAFLLFAMMLGFTLSAEARVYFQLEQGTKVERNYQAEIKSVKIHDGTIYVETQENTYGFGIEAVKNLGLAPLEFVSLIREYEKTDRADIIIGGIFTISSWNNKPFINFPSIKL